MAITYPLSLPSNGLRSISIRRQSRIGQTMSPYTGKIYKYPWALQRWWLFAELPPLKTREAAEAWVSTLIALNGKEGTFLACDTANPLPAGVATGTPLVKGASQSGYDLVTDGWTPGVTGILKRGDWLQLGSGANVRLHKVMLDANSNGSGEATLTLWPRLYSVPADNSAVVVTNPKGLFQLVSDDFEWSIDEARIYGLTFAAMGVWS